MLLPNKYFAVTFTSIAMEEDSFVSLVARFCISARTSGVGSWKKSGKKRIAIDCYD
jgi:hypothetical protein